MSDIFTDFRYAWRMARRSPGATLGIIAMLALGTGGVTAVFNPVYSLIFSPLPFPQPDRLVVIDGDIDMHVRGKTDGFKSEEELGRIFSHLARYSPNPSSRIEILDMNIKKEVFAADVSKDFFKTLGVQPLRGYDFSEETRHSVIISSRFWRNVLMGADDVLDKRINIQGSYNYRIIGIMPDSFDFPAGADIWVRSVLIGEPANSSRRFLGRLHPWISIGQAAEGLRSIGFERRNLSIVAFDGPELQSLQRFLSGEKRPLLWMLGCSAVLFLLLICASVVNILVTLGSRRRSEMAMRLAFGATRRNLIFQLLRETLPLVIVGALAGFWVSEITSALLTARFSELRGVDVAVPVKMIFLVAMVFGVTVIGGLIPALYASGVDLNTYVKSGADFKRRFLVFSLRELLTGLQLSLSLALLTGVGLLITSMMFHVEIPIRWSSRDIAVVKAVFSSTDNYGFIARSLFLQDLNDRLGSMPEVDSAGIFDPIPFSDAVVYKDLMIPLIYKQQWDQQPFVAKAIVRHVSPEGFNILGITLLAGRHFTPADTALMIKLGGFSPDYGRVALVNESFAHQLWPGENPVGKTFYEFRVAPYEIVGVVRNSYHGVGDNKNIAPTMYLPPSNNGSFLVRLHSRSLMNDFRRRLSGLENGSISFEIRPLDEVVSKATAGMRVTLHLLGGFAFLGIIVSGLGVYATTSLMIAAMNREMGIRMAIGARSRDILLLALRRGLRVIFFSLPFGLFLAWILSRVLSSRLFEIKVDDPLAWVISCAALLGITIIAALIPAVRASRVNPMDVLRNG